MSRIAASIAAVLLMALPAAGQTVIGVLGGGAVGADDPGAVVVIDSGSGAATVLGTPLPGESLTGVALLSSGRVLASTATFTGPARLIEIDPATGALVEDIGPLLNGVDPVVLHDLAADPATGALYGISTGSGDRGAGQRASGKAERRPRPNGAVTGGAPTDENALFEIDPATGACTFIGTPAGTSGGFLAIAFLNGSLWAMPTDAPILYEINPSTGAVVDTVGSSGEGALGLGVLDAGASLFLMSGCCENNVGNDIYRIDGITGNPTLLGSAGGSRRVHDMVVVPATAGTVEVPLLDRGKLVVMALLLAFAGCALLLHWRR